MGGNKQQKQSTALVDQERQRQQSEHDQFMNMANPRRDTEQGFADTTRSNILSGYENLYKNATGSTDMFGGNFGSGGGGGISGASYNPVLAQQERASASKASQERANLSGLTGEGADVFRKLSKGGDWDPRIREGYGNFATTGGYSADDISNIRNRAASSSPAFYDAVRNRMSQRANAAGVNQGSIFGAASDRMTREAARGAQENSLNAELGMQDAIRQGKLSGLSGLTGLDTSMNQFRGQGGQGLLNAAGQENELNQFNAGQANQVGMFNAGQENQVGMFNAGQFNDISQFNTNNINDAARFGASSAQSAASANASNAEQMRQNRVREYMAGLSGMQDVYGSTPAELARQEELMQRERFGHTGNIQDNLGLRIQNNPRGPSAMDRIMQGAGIAGSLAMI